MKLLLTSVFKPFGVDDGFNRRENPLEQMHASVTRAQGIFSLHTHNRSYGLILMAENVQAPTTVLDFPTFEEFQQEVGRGYTHVGISFIVPNLDKAAAMARWVREHHPEVTLWIGGHGAQIEGVEELVPCDDACRMEGIRWLREKLGEDPEAPVHHPAMPIEFWRRLMGIPQLPQKAVVVPGLGCRNRCDFCATSHHFQGYVPFFETTEELFQTLVRISDELGVHEFWLMDENFLENEVRARELIELQERHQRFFCFDLFASLRALSRFSGRDLARLGAQFVWVGIESQRSPYSKTDGLDARELFAEARRHGVSILASSILFFDFHDAETLRQDVDYAIALRPDFTQFATLGPLPGTRLWKRLQEEERLLDLERVPMIERHGQGKIWFRHPHFQPEETQALIDEAFEREYQALGPSLMRYARTKLTGYQTLKQVDEPALRIRRDQLREYAREMRPLLPSFQRYAPNAERAAEARLLEQEFRQEFGSLGPVEALSSVAVRGLAWKEHRRLEAGAEAHQPRTFRDHYRQ